MDDGYYIPMLHQGNLQREIEDGYRPDGSSVRIGFEDATFPGYSWRGYARYSPVQDEVVLPVKIKVQSLYRIIYRYMVSLLFCCHGPMGDSAIVDTAFQHV